MNCTLLEMIESYQSEGAIELLVDENYKELLGQVELEISKMSQDGKKISPYSSISPILKDQSIVESDSDSESDYMESTVPDTKYLTFDLDETLGKTVCRV